MRKVVVNDRLLRVRDAEAIIEGPEREVLITGSEKVFAPLEAISAKTELAEQCSREIHVAAEGVVACTAQPVS